MSDDNKPLHEKVYQIVVEGQQAEKQRANAWRGGTDFAARTPLAVWGGLFGGISAAFVHTEGALELFLVPLLGVLTGAGIGWVFGHALHVVFIKIPKFLFSLAVGAFRSNREPPV